MDEWHESDLLILAGKEVPPHLAPAPPEPGSWNIGRLVTRAASVTPAERRALHELVRSMPPPAALPPALAPPALPGPGPMLAALLANRSIKPYSARMLMLAGDGPYVSDSTIAMLGAGRVEVTPRYVSAFAYVLGVPPAELATAVGVPASPDNRPHPAHAELAAIAWDARRLTAGQRESILASTERRPGSSRYCPECLGCHDEELHDAWNDAGRATVEEFESRLAMLVDRLHPGWAPPPAPDGATELTALFHRVNAQRAEAGARLTAQPGRAADLVAEVLDAIVHDGDGRRVGTLARPLAAAVGHRALAERMIAAVAVMTPPQTILLSNAFHSIPSTALEDAHTRFHAALRSR